jgi:hypothetical protein
MVTAVEALEVTIPQILDPFLNIKIEKTSPVSMAPSVILATWEASQGK